MKKSIITCVAFSMLLVCAGSSSAAIIFSDNFETENGGVGQSSYAAFANWTVTVGSVDLLGGGYFDSLAGPGNMCLDMDGSTGVAGTIVSTALNLNPGQYVLYFDAAGSQRWNPSTDTMTVSLGSLFSAPLTLADNAPFNTFATPVINVAAPTVASISFAHAGGDNVGLLLDNVALDYCRQDVIPAPGAILLGGIGAGLVGWLRRRRAL